MIRKLYFCFGVFLYVVAIQCKSDPAIDTLCLNGVKININISTDTDDDIVYLAGNTEGLGNWRAKGLAIPIKDKKGSIQICNYSLEHIEFKVTAGSWAKEAIYKKGSIPNNFKLKPSRDTTISIHIQSWKDEMEVDISGMTGTFDQYIDQSHAGLADRDVIVWLPPEYHQSVDRRYPVVYFHDGQNVFNPSTSTNGVDWGADEWADSLIRKKLIEPMIIVAINCTEDRFLDYSPGKQGSTYMDFVTSTLKSKIDSLYRTKSDRLNTAVVGASMGGLISFMLHWEHNEIFGKAACLSPAFVYQDYNYPMTIDRYEGDRKKLDVYISNGTEGLEHELQAGCDAMRRALNESGYAYQWYLDVGAEHNEEAWSRRLGDVFIRMFRNEMD